MCQISSILILFYFITFFYFFLYVFRSVSFGYVVRLGSCVGVLVGGFLLVSCGGVWAFLGCGIVFVVDVCFFIAGFWCGIFFFPFWMCGVSFCCFAWFLCFCGVLLWVGGVSFVELSLFGCWCCWWGGVSCFVAVVFLVCYLFFVWFVLAYVFSISVSC